MPFPKALSNTILLTFLAFAFTLSSCQSTDEHTANIVPKVSVPIFSGKSISLKNGFSVSISSDSLEDHIPLLDLVKIFENEFYMLTGIKNGETEEKQSIQLYVDYSLPTETYSLDVSDVIKVQGGSYAAVSMALVDLLQLMNEQQEVPGIQLNESPENEYRSLMIDLARGWHDMGVLKEIITLCKWYKINYLHLHLTDDQSFTFPSTAYPKLATENRSFTLESLKELNEYAHLHGVTLVPEIDVPGHSSEIIRKMPELFGIAKTQNNPYTMSMGKEEVYDALGTLIKEIAEVFTYSPYIHIGGDEAFFSGMEDDPETMTYMKKHNLPTMHELFRHFLVRLNDMVKANGKQTMVWAGFAEEGEIEIPRDIIVILWESQYYDPQRLIDDGFKVINASFKPLYVVNNRKWDADYIYTQWNLQRWESWGNTGDFLGVEVNDPNKSLMGATMCVWEQNQINQIHRLRERLPAMAEHLWNPSANDLTDFRVRLTNTDAKLGKLLRPFDVATSGRTFPDMVQGNFYEHLWFNNQLTLEASATLADVTLRYATDGADVTISSPVLNAPITLTESGHVKIQGYNAAGETVGQPFHQQYFLRPITVKTDKLWKDLPLGSWEKLRFEEQMTVSLETTFSDYDLRYTTDGTAPKAESPVYTEPISMAKTTQVRAQLFDQAGKAFGSGFSEVYYLIINEPSLTTNKPITASNEKIAPGAARKANNGRVTLWEQWGGHNDGNTWIKVDLEQITSVSRFKIYNFWDNYRYYQYTIEGSADGETWTQLVDFSENTEKASIEGYEHTIEATEARYLRINLLYNSANPGLHLVEFNAFEE